MSTVFRNRVGFIKDNFRFHSIQLKSFNLPLDEQNWPNPLLTNEKMVFNLDAILLTNDGKTLKMHSKIINQ